MEKLGCLATISERKDFTFELLRFPAIEIFMIEIDHKLLCATLAAIEDSIGR